MDNNAPKIPIKRNTNGDTRVAKCSPYFADFVRANSLHRSDVRETMWRLANMVDRAGRRHDWTKSVYDEVFYKDFCEQMTNPEANFTEMPWYKNIHIKEERHHLLSRCPDDVNLVDVMEMVCDCVCAGLARSGSVRPIEIPNDILQKAVTNTAKLVEDMCEIVEDE